QEKEKNTKKCGRSNTSEILHVRLPEAEKMPFSAEFYQSLDSDQLLFFWTEFFRQLWRRERFPEQEMGQKEWTLLAEMFLMRELNKTDVIPHAHVFPGGIRVNHETDGIQIQR
ncbi:MAG: hypothetical protein Q4C70_06690, partial [Planctomycetia bacterium]|nr:hypothetical protein [Planctomycetia bacterium]